MKLQFNKRASTRTTINLSLVTVAAAGLYMGTASAQDSQVVTYQGTTAYTPSELEGLADSRALASPVLASGTVREQSGAPVSGVPITVVAWPGQHCSPSRPSRRTAAAATRFEPRPAALSRLSPSRPAAPSTCR